MTSEKENKYSFNLKDMDWTIVCCKLYIPPLPTLGKSATVRRMQRNISDLTFIWIEVIEHNCHILQFLSYRAIA